MLKVSDLQFYVSEDLRCKVFYAKDVSIMNLMGHRTLMAYGNGIFNDYKRGIEFKDLRRYDFVWNACICFLEPGFNELTIVIYKND